MSAPIWYNERIREELSRKIASVIATELRDPRIPAVVTIMNIKLASDTRNATISVSPVCEPNLVREAIAALNHAAPFIQNVVAQSMHIRHFPKLHFKHDTSVEYTRHINDLLVEIKDDLDQP